VLRTLDAVPPPGLQETQALLGRLARESQRIQDHQHRLEALKQFFFTLECTLKVSGICIGTTLLSAAVFASVLMLYQIYEGSLSSLTAAKLLEFVRFGLFVGLFAGLCGMVVWFKRSFGRIHKKLES